jgi:hypothetical protein
MESNRLAPPAALSPLLALLLFIFPEPAGAQAFRHPGVVYSLEQLSFIRDKIKAGAQPWKAASDQLKGSSYGNSGHNPNPRSNVDCGTKSNPDIGCGDEREDATTALGQALLWNFTGNEANAKAAVRILDAWAGTVKTHGLYNARLQSGWSGTIWARAAEIIRYTYPGWTHAEIDKFSAMLRNAYLPYLVNGAPEQNGNWEATIVEAMMHMAVFLDDRPLFDKAVGMWRNRMRAYMYLASDGPLPIAPANWKYERIYEMLPPPAPMKTRQDTIINYWYNQGTLVDGLCQETCRDFAHSGYGLASLTYAAETAWLQGLDLYGEMQERMVAAMEFQSKYWNKQPVPKTICGGAINLREVPIFDMGYNHYHNRKGIEMPLTRQWIASHRPMGVDHHMVWATLTHAESGNVGAALGIGPGASGRHAARLGLLRSADGAFKVAVQGGKGWYDLRGARIRDQALSSSSFIRR